VVLIVLITFAGRFSDRVGRKPVMATGCVALIVLSVPAFLLIAQGSYAMVFSGALLIGLMLLCFSSTMPSTLPALFPTDIRYGSLAIAFNVTVAVFGGTTPLIAESLVAATGSDLVPAVLLVVAGVVGSVALYFTRETARQPLPGETPTATSETEAREMSEETQRG
jgi:MHS family proline/betaine transporter-like MFS transporter